MTHIDVTCGVGGVHSDITIAIRGSRPFATIRVCFTSVSGNALGILTLEARAPATNDWSVIDLDTFVGGRIALGDLLRIRGVAVAVTWSCAPRAVLVRRTILRDASTVHAGEPFAAVLITVTIGAYGI